MGLLELVEKENRERLLAHAADQGIGLDGGLAAPSENLTRGVVCLKFAHIKTNQSLDRAEQELRDGFGKLCLAGASRAGEQEDADGLHGVIEPGLEHCDAVHDSRNRIILAENAPG
jgi:hypothetical protein